MNLPVRKKWLWILAAGLLLVGFSGAAGFELSEIFSLVETPEISVGWIVILLALATLISEDLTCLTAGTLVSQGKIGFALAVLACGAGIFVGDILIYGAGRFFGRRALETKIFGRLFSEEKLRQSSAWLNKYGRSAVLLSRFTFGLRLPIYFAAGTLKTNFFKFAFYFALAVSLWTPLIVGLSGLIGAEVFKMTIFQKNFQLAFVVFIIAFYFLLRVLLKLANWKERRLFVGRIKRITRWEFWPVGIFYIPVIVYIINLAIRHRSLTVFTCANPGIPSGGFVGESKDEIYQNLKKSAAASAHLLPCVLLKRESSMPKKIARVWDFIDEHKLSFPLVLKPDKGERGRGVVIVKTFLDLKKALETAEKDYLLQEYAAGAETSVFYYRYPRKPAGEIFSITEKRFPKVFGDGASTLEELILKDGRAVCLAKSYFERNREKLESVPAKGEAVELIDIGTHWRGAIFLDGNFLKTPALEKKIDRICRQFEGFYFGRFDLRAPSLDDFRRGENFKIIELNGVSSESTDIYDARNSLFKAYKVLFRQWRIAFEIGEENRRRGVGPLPLFEIIRLVYENLYRKTPKSSASFRELSKQPNN